MLIENVVDLDARREAKKRDDETFAIDYVNDQIDHFVAALVDDLQSKGVDEAEAEKLIGARMSDLVLAFDLRYEQEESITGDYMQANPDPSKTM